MKTIAATVVRTAIAVFALVILGACTQSTGPAAPTVAIPTPIVQNTGNPVELGDITGTDGAAHFAPEAPSTTQLDPAGGR